MNLILVGVDRSDTSRRAAERAAALAANTDATLHLLMCVGKSRSDDAASGQLAAHGDDEAFLVGLAEELPHARVTTNIASGDPATVLSDEAKRLEASVIVVGNRRVQGVSRVLGSVAMDVVRHAPCDVLIANTTG